MPVPLTPNFDAQRLYDKIDLVNRVGDRSQQELCVMSLVALMAGERHSDRPDCACAVITAYAIKLNDALDDETRQGLKPFAPRIIGTRDGYEAERARFIVTRILRDVVPHMIAPHGANRDRIVAEMPLRSGESPTDATFRIGRTIREAVRTGELSRSRGSDLRYMMRAHARGSHELVATAAAVLLANCARLTDLPEQSRWYWNFATDLLDKACDVGISGTRSTADIERMSQQAAAELQVSVLKAKFNLPCRRRLASIFRAPSN